MNAPWRVIVLGDSRVRLLGHRLPVGKKNSRNKREVACYPGPGSSFAQNALDAVEQDVDVLLHVGRNHISGKYRKWERSEA